MLRGTTIAWALLALVAGARPVSAGRWEPFGPTEPRVFVLAVDPADARIVYAGGRNVGVFRSENRGRRWQPAREGLPRGDILSLAIDPERTTTLYAGTDFGVFKSTDGGGAWRLASADLQSSTTALAIAASNPPALYAGSKWGDGIARSSDGGSTWSVVWREENAPEVHAVLALAVDPTKPETVYALVQPLAILRTTDAGRTWERHDVGTPPSLTSAALLVDPENPTRLFAAAGNVLRSDDGGATWIGHGPPSPGLHWSALAITRRTPASLYVAGDDGVFVTSDAADHWTRLPVAAPGVWCEALATDGKDAVYAGTTAGVFASDDGGRSFAARQRGFFGGVVSALAVGPTHPVTLYVAPAYKGVMRSTDGGESWTPTGADLAGTFVHDLVVDPTQPSTLYAGRLSADGGGGGVSKSTDAGKTWALMREGLPRDAYSGASGPHASVTRLLLDPADPRTLYALLHLADASVYRTRDGAATWTPIGLGGKPGVLDDIETLAIDPTRRGRLYAGARDGFVYRTSDGGDTWTNLGRLSDDAVSALAVDPSRPETVCAGLALGGVRRSSDGGLTWTAVGPGLPAAAPVVDLAIDAAGVIYADTTEGVFRSGNHGRTWRLFEEGMFPATSGEFGSRLFLDRAGRLYRTVSGSGVYRRDLEGVGRIRDVGVGLRGRQQGLVIRGTLEDGSTGTIDPARTGLRVRVVSPTAGTLLDVDLPAGSSWRRQGRSWAYVAEPGGLVVSLRIREGRFALRATATGIPPASEVASLSVLVVFPASVDAPGSNPVAAASDVRCRHRRNAGALSCRPPSG